MPVTSTVLVTGAASGLGRCFAAHYLKQPNTKVIAVDRNKIDLPQPSDEQLLECAHVDMASADSIKDMVDSLGDQTIHVIIHCAGIRGLVPKVERDRPDDVAAAETLQVMDTETMMRAFAINTAGTFALLQKLLPFFNGPGTCTKVIVLTSRMGSISCNKAGGAYAYRASKAALNAIVRSMSIDLPHTLFALLHPGRVESGLTRCREEGAIEADESVQGMLELISRLELKDGGRFMDRFGIDIKW